MHRIIDRVLLNSVYIIIYILTGLFSEIKIYAGLIIAWQSRRWQLWGWEWGEWGEWGELSSFIHLSWGIAGGTSCDCS